MRKAHLTACLLLVVCVWILAPNVHARDEDVVGRFTRQIDALAALFSPGGKALPPEQLAQAMIDGKVRNQLFRLEGLLRFYVRARPDLDKYRLEIKELEDGLGAYTFAADSLSFAKDKFTKDNLAQAPDAARQAAQDKVLATLTTAKDVARGAFAGVVAQSKFSPDLPGFRTLVVSRFGGWSASKNLGYVKDELQRMLKKVREHPYDFNNLEDGIHEFRRQLRWFPVVIDSLDGLILLRDDAPGTAPIPALESLAGSAAAKHRYANPALRFPAAQPCMISRTLLWQVVKTTNDLGTVKDEAQGNAAIAEALDNDVYVTVKKGVTPEEIARAKAMRTELFSTKALEALMKQISSCK